MINDLPHMYVLENGTGSCISACYYLAAHHDTYATVGLNP
jgi:hypothetical protein